MVNTERLSTQQKPSVSVIRKIGHWVIAGFVLVITVVTGIIAGLIGILVRGQLPETEEMESAPKKDAS